MARFVKLPTITKNRKNQPFDAMVICDNLEDFIATADNDKVREYAGNLGQQWAGGGKTFDQCLNLARHGNISLVAKSDKLIKELEDSVAFLASGYRTIDSVVGGGVNVGAYASGIPNCMRQRRRTMAINTPLSIVVDLTISAALNSKQIAARGSAMLALVRLLSAIRPTDLYLAISVGSYGCRYDASTGVLIPVNTKPLELATAGNAMLSTGFTRMLGYSTAYAHSFSDGSWPFDDVGEYRRLGVEYWQRFCGTDELLFMPPAYADDENLRNPSAWLKGMLAQYGGMAIEN